MLPTPTIAVAAPITASSEIDCTYIAMLTTRIDLDNHATKGSLDLLSLLKYARSDYGASAATRVKAAQMLQQYMQHCEARLNNYTGAAKANTKDVKGPAAAIASSISTLDHPASISVTESALDEFRAQLIAIQDGLFEEMRTVRTTQVEPGENDKCKQHSELPKTGKHTHTHHAPCIELPRVVSVPLMSLLLLFLLCVQCPRLCTIVMSQRMQIDWFPAPGSASSTVWSKSLMSTCMR